MRINYDLYTGNIHCRYLGFDCKEADMVEVNVNARAFGHFP